MEAGFILAVTALLAEAEVLEAWDAGKEERWPTRSCSGNL
jgi:hypothetical protein